MKQAGGTLGAGTIVGEGDNVPFITKQGNGNFLSDGKAIEYPSDGSAVDFIAYYPYQSTLDNYIYKVDVTNQSKPEEIDLLYADNLTNRTATSTTGNLQFYHQLSQLVLNLSSSDNTDFSNLSVTISGVKTKANFNLVDGSMAKTKVLAGRKLALVPILRAGMGMLDGMLTLLPAAKVGFIGLYRNEETLQPVEYFCKLPQDIAERDVLVLDPMLATGGSAIDAITQIKKHGAKRIKFIGLIAAPEGIEALHKAHPDVDIYLGAKDDHLNENGYIVPGLGDAGDRIYGTK